MRTVVLICEHTGEGSFGLVLSRKLKHTIGEIMSGAEGSSMPVCYGGPVSRNSLHFIHRCPGLISGGDKILDDVYWGGEFEEVCQLLRDNKLHKTDIRFFVGYSGWSSGQLEEEMETGSWLIVHSTAGLIFNTGESEIWKAALKKMGGEYEQLINYPIDPALN